jgi:hypothetical protein
MSKSTVGQRQALGRRAGKWSERYCSGEMTAESWRRHIAIEKTRFTDEDWLRCIAKCLEVAENAIRKSETAKSVHDPIADSFAVSDSRTAPMKLYLSGFLRFLDERVHNQVYREELLNGVVIGDATYDEKVAWMKSEIAAEHDFQPPDEIATVEESAYEATPDGFYCADRNCGGSLERDHPGCAQPEDEDDD